MQQMHPRVDFHAFHSGEGRMSQGPTPQHFLKLYSFVNALHMTLNLKLCRMTLQESWPAGLGLGSGMGLLGGWSLGTCSVQ